MERFGIVVGEYSAQCTDDHKLRENDFSSVSATFNKENCKNLEINAVAVADGTVPLDFKYHPTST